MRPIVRQIRALGANDYGVADQDRGKNRVLDANAPVPSELTHEALGCLYLNSLREYLCRAGADQAVVEAFPPASAMVTFWLRQDQQDNGLAEAVAETVNDWLLNDWPLGSHVFRVLPDERSSRRALQRLNLLQTHLTLPGDGRPYLWYQSA